MWNLLRKRFSRMSMRSKLFLTIIAMVTLIDLLIVLFLPAYSRSFVYEDLTASARSTSGMIADRIARASSIQAGIQQFAERHSNSVRFIVVLDSAGNEVSSINRSLAEEARAFDVGDEPIYDSRLQLFTLRSRFPFSAEATGILFVGYSGTRLEQRLVESRWVSVGFSGAVMILGIIAAFFVSRIITRPLREVAATVESISAGNLSERIDIHTDDELGQVATAFNAMVENLEFAYRELRTSIADLQHKADDLQHEVNERQKAVEAMQESEHRYRTLSDATFEGIVLEESGRIVDANDQLLDLLGYQREELLDRSSADMLAPESRRVGQEPEMPGASEVQEQLCLRKDGSTFPVEMRSRDLLFGGQRFRVTAVRDITERKRAEEELRRANDSLERKVHDRTAELRTTNTVLQKEIDERMAIERALRESEARYRSLVNNMKEVVFQTDGEGRWTFLNPSWSLITGYHLEDSLGRPAFEFMLDDDRPLSAELFDCLRNGTHEFCHKELRFRTVDGRARWLEMFARAMRDPNRQLVATSGTLRDVTDLRIVERALRDSKEFLDRIVNSVGDPLFVKDRQHRLAVVNDSMCSFMGKDRSELLGKSDYDILSKAEADAVWSKDEEVFLSGIESTNEETMTDALGTVRTVMTKKNLYQDDKGQEFLVGIIRDVTVLKQAEREIRQLNEELERRVAVRTYELQTTNKELLREIGERKRIEAELRKLTRAIEQSPISVVITDIHGNIEYVNPKFVEVTGYAPEEVLGKNPRVLKSGRLSAEMYKDMWRTILSGQEWRGEFQNKKKNGEIFWEQATISPIKDVKGQLTHFIAAKEDITERKAIEAQFRRTQRLEIIGTLAGGIAHDLNNVLAPILMGIQILRLKVHDDKGKQIISTIEASANRGADIVKQVLTFARGSEGERSVLQVKHLLREVEEIAHETFPRSIKIGTHIPKDLWVVNGDATQLHQVFMNLCVNARDAMPDGGSLTITAENIQIDDRFASLHVGAKKGAHVIIIVADTGMGITPEVMEKIFDPFFTTKDIGKGTGLGLPTVQTIVRSHGGFVTVYSEVGKGTQFKVYLPAGEVRAGVKAETEPAEIPRGNGELILVVDDEQSVREITREILGSFGYEVLLARDGMEALAIFNKHANEIRVVLTDMMMPQMDGAVLIRELRAVSPDVRIIAASGLANYENSNELHLENVHAFLTKPYKAERLLWVLDTVLR